MKEAGTEQGRCQNLDLSACWPTDKTPGPVRICPVFLRLHPGIRSSSVSLRLRSRDVPVSSPCPTSVFEGRQLWTHRRLWLHIMVPCYSPVSMFFHFCYLFANGPLPKALCCRADDRRALLLSILGCRPVTVGSVAQSTSGAASEDHGPGVDSFWSGSDASKERRRSSSWDDRVTH